MLEAQSGDLLGGKVMFAVMLGGTCALRLLMFKSGFKLDAYHGDRADFRDAAVLRKSGVR